MSIFSPRARCKLFQQRNACFSCNLRVFIRVFFLFFFFFVSARLSDWNQEKYSSLRQTKTKNNKVKAMDRKSRENTFTHSICYGISVNLMMGKHSKRLKLTSNRTNEWSAIERIKRIGRINEHIEAAKKRRMNHSEFQFIERLWMR